MVVVRTGRALTDPDTCGVMGYLPGTDDGAFSIDYGTVVLYVSRGKYDGRDLYVTNAGEILELWTLDLEPVRKDSETR